MDGYMFVKIYKKILLVILDYNIPKLNVEIFL